MSELFTKSFDNKITHAERRRKVAQGVRWLDLMDKKLRSFSGRHKEPYIASSDINPEAQTQKANILSNFKTLAELSHDKLQTGRGVKITAEQIPLLKTKNEARKQGMLYRIAAVLGGGIQEETETFINEPHRVEITLHPVFSRFRKNLRGWNVSMANRPSDYQIERRNLDLEQETFEDVSVGDLEGRPFQDTFYIGRNGTVLNSPANTKRSSAYDSLPSYAELDAKFGLLHSVVMNDLGAVDIQQL